MLLLMLCCCFALATYAQQSLKGRVVDAKTNEPLEHVSVYLNTTTRGTATNDKGEFALPFPTGSYEVIVSYLGYEPIIYAINSDSLPPGVLFKLQAKENLLGVVEIKGQRDKQWHQNLEVFKEHFLGRSWLARACKLLNPEVLIIDFDHATGLLSVRANEPLLIENTALGYKLEYLLTEFTYRTKESYVTYQGYTRYELMPGGRSRQRRWEKNRQVAYNGSAMHFVRALQQKRLEEEGFNLRRLYRLPNPNRPSEEEIAAARAHIREYGPEASNDSIADVLSRARLSKFVERLDPKPVPYGEYLRFEKGKARVAFDHLMQVVYIGEKEEPAYVSSRNSLLHKSGPATPTFQTSVFSLQAGHVELEASGIFLNPLDVVFEGYWGWEKVGDMLPLDYQL
jgi:hypothetical protein